MPFSLHILDDNPPFTRQFSYQVKKNQEKLKTASLKINCEWSSLKYSFFPYKIKINKIYCLQRTLKKIVCRRFYGLKNFDIFLVFSGSRTTPYRPERTLQGVRLYNYWCRFCWGCHCQSTYRRSSMESFVGKKGKVFFL